MDQKRLERIRLLSCRFHELQGLRVALFGALIAVVMGSYSIAVPTPTEAGFYIALAVTVVLAIPAELRLSRYYATTFGRQVRQAQVGSRLVVAFVMLFCINLAIEPLDPESGTPTAVVVGVLSLWVAVRDWPWRGYYVGTAAAAAIAVTANIAAGGALDRGVVLTTTYFLLGVSMVPIGVLDHRLLVRLTEEVRDAAAASPAGATDRER